MRILIAGASGFIGRHVARALRDAGQEVHELRRRASPDQAHAIAGDFRVDLDPALWHSRLRGIDAVINAVGILKPSRDQSFKNLHSRAPKALFDGCVQAGVRRVIQISALGADAHAQSGYHLSKSEADRHLMQLPLAWCILRPSLVFGEGGASARLFAGLATMPIVFLPGSGGQRVQPVHIDDLTELCVRILMQDACKRCVVDVVGPRAYSIRELLCELRTSMGLGTPRFVTLPEPLVRAFARLAAPFARIALDAETLQMLARGNEASPAGITAALGRPPRAAIPFFAASSVARPIPLADWARLNWLLPLLRVSVALVWIITGILSLGLYPVAESYALLARAGLHGVAASVALYGAAVLDLALGVGTLVLRRRLWLWRLQIALMLGYSLIVALALPEYWLHPFGPLLKNVPLLALLLALHELERRS